jgi:hypothetical protein
MSKDFGKELLIIIIRMEEDANVKMIATAKGQKPNHCRVAPLTFQGQDNKCETTKFQGQEYLQPKMLCFYSRLCFDEVSIFMNLELN